MIDELKASFEKHAARSAFCIEDRLYTYNELSIAVDDMYTAMEDAGGSKTRRVAVIANDSLMTYAAIIACWRTNYAYVPIHPKSPAERTSVILKEANIDLVIDAGKLSTIGDARSSGAAQSGDILRYILFTSGSTGVPKGVPISDGNIRSFLDSYNLLGFDCCEEDRFLQMFDLTFDVSVASFLVPLLIGACVYTVPQEGVKYTNVYKILSRHKITFASIVPSIINYLRPYFSEIKLPHLKYCILTAEASNIQIVKEWQSCLAGTRIFNLYGPTEATIWCTGYFFQPDMAKSYNEMLIIGKPFKNVKAVIVDDDGKAAAVNAKGELYISSTQVTSGYLNNPEKNRDVFLEWGGGLFYKTGDLCFRDAEGDIFYCGRKDHQVKIQGFRIELSEIEVVARELFARNNAAIVFKNNMGVDQIALFVEGYAGDVTILKRELEKRLPYYMTPSAIIAIKELPHNTSGKIDRVSLVKHVV